MSLASLFLMHVPSNTGYAIAPLETLFYEAGLELAEGDPKQVHFGYSSLEKGLPTSLPQSFTNVIPFDFKQQNPAQIQHLTRHVAEKRIRFVLIFDIQVVDPLFRPLRQAGVATIVTYWGAPISSRMPWWKLALKRLQVGLSRSKVDGLIFESQAMADLAIYGRGVPPDMIDIVPLGVDIKLFSPDRSDYVYTELGLPKERKVIIYVGHMEERKGVRALVEAAIELLVKRRRPDVCFILFGNKGEESKQYESLYSGLGIDDLIRFGGYRSDLAKIYPSCFCGVIPSTGWDSYPRSSVEMAASGLPVVASRLQGLCEAVVDGKTGLLFEPGNPMRLAHCIETLLDRPELAAQYGEQGRMRCETELNRSIQRQRLIAVLRKRLGLVLRAELPGSTAT